MLPNSSQAPALERHHFAWLSIAAAVATISLKTLAWWLTGSVGLLSDALESFVNLAGASFALWMIIVATRPPDEDHPFGHSKAEYFSSGFEGILILGAAAAIIWAAAERLADPHPLESLGIGLVVSAVATAINLGVAISLKRAAVRFASVALAADSRHLMTDVVTSVGVLIGVAAVGLTGLQWLDPLIAIAVGLNILVEGVRLMRGAVDGLMDRGLDEIELERIRASLADLGKQGVYWQGLRTRRAGSHAWIELVLAVPGGWSIDAGHALSLDVEARLAAAVPGAVVTTRLVPAETSGATEY